MYIRQKWVRDKSKSLDLAKLAWMHSPALCSLERALFLYPGLGLTVRRTGHFVLALKASCYKLLLVIPAKKGEFGRYSKSNSRDRIVLVKSGGCPW